MSSSSYIYKKLPYEGNLSRVKELFQDYHWNLEIKVPEEGIILAKIPKSLEEEIGFSQGMNIDEETKTKFGTFITITETDFEQGINNELNILDKEQNENKKNLETNKKNKNKEYKRQISEILLNEETPPVKKENFLKKFTLPKIDFDEMNKKIKEEYKDPYDYFFSQNYLIMCFIFAVIVFVVFNF